MKSILHSIILVSTMMMLSQIKLKAQSPNFMWTRAMGDTILDYGNSVVSDNLGNVYTVGTFQGTVDFNPGAGTNNLTSFNGPGAFISKLDANGNFLWAKKITGTSLVYGNDIAINSSGELFIVGLFYGTTDFNPSILSTNNISSSGNSDAFVLKLDNAGAFDWVKTFGDNDSEAAESIALGSNGEIHVTGRFEQTVDFNPGAGTNNLTATNEDAYILKLDASGNHIWSRKLGGIGDEIGLDLVVDAIGNVYSVGRFDSIIDLDPNAISNLLITTNGLEDIYISKLSSLGNFLWGKRIGNANENFVGGIAIDTTGNPYISGYFEGTMDLNPGTGATNLIANFTDVFILKLTASSGNFSWVKQIGGGNFDRAYGITIDKSNNIYTVGQFKSIVDFDPNAGAFNLNTTGNGRDLFILKLSDAGNFIWVKATGGPGNAFGQGITISSTNDVLVTGYFDGTVDFDDPNAFNISSNGSQRDVFIYKLNQNNLSGFDSQDNSQISFSIFPNPTRTELNIVFKNKFESSQIQIVDMLGKELFLKEYIGLSETIDVSRLHNGIYYLHLITNGKVQGTRKFIIE